MINFPRIRRTVSAIISLVAVTMVSLMLGCDPTILTVPDKPFDPNVTHIAEVIAPAENVIFLTAGADLEYQAQNAVLSAAPGTTIVFPVGTHAFSDEFIVNTSHITLAGAGMDKTTLDFGSQETGAQGILVLGNYFTIQDLAIVNPAGDGIRIDDTVGPTIRRLKVEWTSRGDENNGAYGIYPVLCTDVLIEDSIAIGASDAGVYVGQSNNIIVRRNTVEYNVAGIEIENSKNADVYDNWTAHNTAGILVFDLPGLTQSGSDTHIFNNVIYQNTTHSFAPAGNIVGLVPSGIGVMVMANVNVEVDNNQIIDHGTASVGIVSFLISGRSFDPESGYNPFPLQINVHDNVMDRYRGTYKDGNELNFALNLLYFGKGDVAHIIYDGIGEVEIAGGLPEGQKLCVRNNVTQEDEAVKFGNVNFQNLNNLGIPVGPVWSDTAPHDCTYTTLPTITIPERPEPPADNGGAGTENCDATLVTGLVNQAAANSDCLNLAEYNLFANASDPLGATNGNGTVDGVEFDLATPLFSDYAHKMRQVFIPAGTQIQYSEGDMTFPIGTIISKTFYYVDNEANPQNVDLVETRLLINRDSGWQRLPYIWNNGVATLALGGGTKQVSWIDAQGVNQSTTYGIPNINQCSSCHGPKQTDKPLGPKAARLNKDYAYATGTQNQLSHWTTIGILAGAPGDVTTAPKQAVWNDAETGSLDERALAYLDSNCAHCHGEETGRAKSTALWLNAERATIDEHTGVCKHPIAAGPATEGREFDIVPGDADASIMTFRMNSVQAEVKMPELAKSMVHTEGVQLISEWINSLPGGPCL